MQTGNNKKAALSGVKERLLVSPTRFELISLEPESNILSIELRGRFAKIEYSVI